MDIALLIGMVGAALLLIVSIVIAGSPLTAFWDTPSIAMVCGGAIMAAFACYPLKILLTFPKIALKALRPTIYEVQPVISQLVQFAEIARRDGLLALENKSQDIQDPFLMLGIQLAVDGTEATLIESIMRSEMEAVAGRHRTGKAMLDTLNKYAPAWGMIGTLVGLVIMLGNMSDPSKIGPGMAVALLTTLYGALISNMVFGPMADKLSYYSRKELEVREIIIRGILSIQDGDNPRVLEQKLKTFLSPKDRAGFTKNAA